MPYIGRELDRGNYLKLDDISSSFNGSTTTFNLTNGGKAFYPGSAFSILVVLAGVVQEPEAAYQINQTQITFASAPLAGDQFFCIVLGQALGVNTPANGSVNGAQLAKPFNYDNYFYLDDANNRVGVGTATPMTPLHVEGTGRFTNVTVTGDLTVEGTTSTLDTVVTEVDKLEVGANNNTVGVAITQSGSGDAAHFMGGNVGIGTDNPAKILDVQTPAGGRIQFDKTGSDGSRILFAEADGTLRAKINNYGGSNETLALDAPTNIDFLINGAEKVRIDSAGNLGVGLLVPNQKLHLHAAGSGGNKIKFTNDTTATGASDGFTVGIDGSENAELRLDEATNMLFVTNSTERLRITSVGNVGIGTDNPQSQFEVYGSSPIVRSKHSTSQKYTQINHNGTDGYLDWSSGNLIFRGASNAERLRIKSDGNVGIKNTSPNNTLTVGDTIQPSYTPASAGNYIEIARTSGGDTGLLINKNTGQWLIGIDNSDGANAPLRFEYGAAGSAHPGFGAGTLGMFMKHDGNIGIGTDSPAVIAGMSKYLTLSSKTVDHAVGFELQGNRTGTDQTVGRISFINNANEIARINVDSASGGTNGNLTVITSGTERIRVNADGKVGVGTDSLGHRFTVYGSNTVAKFQSSTPYVDLMFQNTGATNGFIQYNNAGNFKFYANSGGTPTLVISAGAPGNVGIGEDTPDVRLHVKEQFDTAYSLTSVTTDTNHLLKLENPSTTANAFAGMQFRVGSGADLYFGAIQQSVNHGDFFFANQNTPQREMMRIKSSGLVGIGTDNPDTQLHVFGSSTTGQLKLGGGNGAGNHRVYINCHETDSYIDSYGNNAYGKLRINAAPLLLNESGGGNVGIGTNNADKKLRVEGDARITGTLTIASTVIDGSVDYPTIRPVLDLNFATNKFLDDRITFRRDSIATYYGADGLLKYASVNEPRFPYDPDTGESLGLLIEDPGTNLISGSGGYGSDIRNGNNLGNAPTSTVVDGITLPDGRVGQVRRIQIHPSGNSGMRWGSTGGGNINTPYSASVWARAVSGTASFSIDANDNGTVNYTLTEEWVRMQCTGQTGEGAYQFMDLMGTGGHDAYFWGFQLENNGLVTSYIPVESHMSNNTRANDVAYITGENFTDFYNQSEGTLVLSADIAYLPTSNQAAVVFENTSSGSTDLIALGYRVGGGASGNLGSWYQGNGTQVAYLNHNAGITANTEFRQAFAYKKDNLASSVNGGTPQTDNSGTLSTSIDRVKFGGYYADSMKSGHIRYFKYFNKRLSNAQLQGLTTQ